MIRGLLFLVLSPGLVFADIAAIKSEPNPEKRSDLALAHAEEEIDAAKKAYDANDLPAFRKNLDEVTQLVDVSQESLESTGKRARKSPKYFKRAEQKLLVLIRRVDSLEKSVMLEDREPVVEVRKHMAAVHDRILNDIMTRK